MKCKYLDFNGYDSDIEKARKKGLKKNEYYEFDDIDIGNWTSYIYLKGLKGSFNSVMFQYYLDGEEIDIIDYYEKDCRYF